MWRDWQAEKPGKYLININVPVIYMARDIMILMVENPFEGHWKGCALKIMTFLGPKMTTSEASAIWAQQS
jgi:hypothetical protein